MEQNERDRGFGWREFDGNGDWKSERANGRTSLVCVCVRRTHEMCNGVDLRE